MLGTVLCGSNNFFEVECADGIIRTCSIKGKKLKDSQGFYNPLAPLDNVHIEIDAHQNEQGQIIELEKRKNMFVRWNSKGRAPQLLAANLDYLLCITTPDLPPFRPRFIDRLLIQAEDAHIEPVIVCNKTDLDFDADVEFMLSEWVRLGYKIVRVSAQTKEGMRELAKLIAKKSCAFVGQSGVGKSSILNALDSNLSLKTGNLSQKYIRGKHTTTQGFLYDLHTEFGISRAVDTPGIRRFILHNIDKNDIIHYFKEMAPHLGTCTFGMSCTHTHEAGCKILEAIHAGRITQERYESWQRIRDEVANGTWAD